MDYKATSHSLFMYERTVLHRLKSSEITEIVFLCKRLVFQ